MYVIREAFALQVFIIERTLMANEALRKTMGDYHDLVESGRQEIFRVES